MDLAGLTVANPTFVQVDKNYLAWANETIDGPNIRLITRKPASGSAYVRPKYTIKLTFEDLAAPERTQLENAIDILVRAYGILTLAGLGTVRVIPPGLGSGTVQDSAYVTLATNIPPRFDSTQGYKAYAGIVYGPIIYKLDLTLLGNDIQYLYE